MKSKTTPLAVGLLLAAILTTCMRDNGSRGTEKPDDFIQAFKLKRAEVYLTARDTDARLSLVDSLAFREFRQPDEFFPTLMLDPQRQFQTIEGFGGALTDAAAETLARLPEKKQREILTAYFDRKDGIGYTLCRTPINSCDFSSSSYAYDTVEGDVKLEHFAIGHDLRYRIPLIRSAMETAGEDFRLFASPWSPPAWMKTNHDMLHGGKLKRDYCQAWADYFVKFIRAYEKEGVPVWGVTVQNEPMATQIWESCLYTAEEERDFVRDYLGPTLAGNGLGRVKIIIWDHNRGIMTQRAQVVYDDPEASKYVWGTGFHWYTGDHFENVGLHARAFPDKKLLFTEGCTWPFSLETLNDWKWGEIYGESLIHDLNNSTVGWVDWNILLNEQGGPNHVSNFCNAPVIADTRTGELYYTSSYYYLGHFSKFIRPGARRIICASNNDELQATAFINPDGQIALVAMNRTDREIDFRIWIQNKGVQSAVPAHAIATVLIH